MEKEIYTILKKYKNGATIDDDADISILEEYASTGMVHIRFNYKTNKAEARLTKEGKSLLKIMSE